MADLKYVVRLAHDGRGIAFSAREALRNAAKQSISPIRQVVFSGEPTGASSRLEVTIDDSLLCRTITNAIDISGRMPHDPGSYTIESVVLQTKDIPTVGKDIQKDYAAAQREVVVLRDENARLRQDLTRPRVEVHTPLDGLLAYFESTKYSPEVLLEDSADLDFARRVFGKEMNNTLSDYITHILGESVTEDEVERILTSTLDSSEEMEKLRSQYDIARKELDFFAKLKSGEAMVPESLLPSLISTIEAKNHPVTINAYESRVKEQEELNSKQDTFRQLKQKYDSFSEKIDLLNHAGGDIPVIFNFNEDGVDLYFPFQSRIVTTGFVGDLREEVKAYFGTSTIKPLDHKFVAYRVTDGPSLKENIDRLIEDTPVTLRVAGFNRIAPYRLG